MTKLKNQLLCPACGNNNLHQLKVDAYFRKEDSAIGFFTSCEYGAATADPESPMHANPSSRRDGVRISFECEHCNGRPELTIVQHKGTTYLDMVYFKPVDGSLDFEVTL